MRRVSGHIFGTGTGGRRGSTDGHRRRDEGTEASLNVSSMTGRANNVFPGKRMFSSCIGFNQKTQILTHPNYFYGPAVTLNAAIRHKNVPRQERLARTNASYALMPEECSSVEVEVAEFTVTRHSAAETLQQATRMGSERVPYRRPGVND